MRLIPILRIVPVVLAICLAGHAGAGASSGFRALSEYVATLDGERREGGEFLLKYLPDADRETLSLDLFRENLEQAFIARESYPWTKGLSKDDFFNDVLPYAAANETRDPWRKRLRELFGPKIAGCGSVSEVDGVVGSFIVELTGVSYNTGREKACQSPAESIRQGKASCTGLSILKVGALRALGVPARLAAIPMWGTLEGNHTWVEVHDGKDWQMTDYSCGPDEWNKGWAIDRCAYCDPGQPVHGVFATSYRPTGLVFPMTWDWSGMKGNPSLADLAGQERDSDGKLVKLDWPVQGTKVPGIDRTAHYIALAGGRKLPIPKGSACVAVRAFIRGSKTRVDVALRVFRGNEKLMEGRTATQAQDLNDYVRLLCAPSELRIEYQKADGEWQSIQVNAAAGKETAVKIEISESDAAGFFTIDQRRVLADWLRNPDQVWPGGEGWPTLDCAADVDSARAELWSIFRETRKTSKVAKELGPLPAKLADLIVSAKAGKVGVTPGSLTLGEHRMPFVLIRKEAESPPASGRSLYLCMHGGGRNPKAEGAHAWAVNTREWQSQVGLAAQVYDANGVFFIPRMADDRLGRWWYGHVQDAFDEVIRHGIAEWDVDSDRVYILGISEGAYGTQILGPFMADRFGGANAMAGGVGDDVPAENLRNLAFRTDVGEKDTMFDRVGLARKFHARMDSGKEEFGGYVNRLNVQEGKGHGVDYRPGFKWMVQHERNPVPASIVWTSKLLDKRRRPSFYWLGLSVGDFDGNIHLTAEIEGERVGISAKSLADEKDLTGVRIAVMLDERLLDLGKPVNVVCNGKSVHAGPVRRSLETLARSLSERGDPKFAFPVEIDIEL